MRTVLMAGIATLLLGVGAAAADATWTGQISDSMCGAKHTDAKHGKKMSDRDCALACAAKGAQLVLVSDGTIYKLTNHDADLRAHAGHTVKVTGTLTGDSIRVAKIEMASASDSRR
jgi:uncharacterized protein DUF5818